MIIKDLGAVSAYAYAVEKGYTGTEEEFAVLMASYATVAEEAAESAESASASATSASASAQTATTKASEATTAAQTATAKAEEAQADADAAALDASQALSAASTATSKASEAAQSASDAATAKTAAQTAQTAAEGSATTAQTAAQTATQKAAEAAESASSIERCIRYDSAEEYPDYESESEIAFTDGYAINTDGSIVAVSGYAVSDLIPLENIYQVYRYGTLTKFTLRRYALYDENENLLQYYASTTAYDFTTINGRDSATEYNLVVNGVKASYIRIEKEIERTMYHFVKVPEKHVYHFENNDIITDTISELKEIEAKTKLIQFAKKKIVNLGDSIFGAVDDSTSTSTQIGLYVNGTVVNCAFGGTKACNRNDNLSNWRAFDLLAISESIVSGDWTAQETALENSASEASNSSNKLPSYFASRLSRLEDIDFSTVDIVTFNYGTNDYTDSADERVLYKTRLETCIKAIQTAYPNILFVGISPAWRIFLNIEGKPDSDTYYASWSGGQNVVLPLWCEAMKDVCNNSLHIPFIDCYNIGINRANYTRYFPTNDGTHHSDKGRARLGEHIARGLIAYC